jgi:3-deoxy-D-manno-octulosonic-acid transferase
VLVLDTIGELSRAYALASLAIVGGSLVDVGGHSVFEPAAFGCPILIGPHDDNFREESAALEAAGALVRVRDEEEIHRRAREWMIDPARARSAGEAGRAVVAGRAGATARVAETVARLIPRSSQPVAASRSSETA